MITMALLVLIIVLVAQLEILMPTFPILVVALATGRMSFMTAFAAAAAGSVMADSIWFTTSWIYGLRLARCPRGIGALEWPVASIERGRCMHTDIAGRSSPTNTAFLGLGREEAKAMSDSGRNEQPPAIEPSYVMRQSVALPAEELSLRPESESRSDCNASRQNSHKAAWVEEQGAQVSPRDAVRRQSASWPGMAVDIVQGLGAGAGNTPMEVFVAVCARMGIETGVDLFKISDVAEDIVVPMMDHPIRIDRDSLTLGFAGVYSTFLLFAKRAEAKYRIPAREILLELGRRGVVGGQEDMLEDAALTIARQREAS
jgi:hypothetical protein